jgi:hypothetical protein
MEVGLKALAKSIRIQHAPSWDGYLTKIYSKLEKRPRTRGVRWKRDEKFLREMSGDLIAVKQAWRNPSMHIERRYSKEEAEEIFIAVRTFMRKLAAKLNQDGKDVSWLSISP